MIVHRPHRTRRVLIAHQSTIPHYRVPFYRAVERLRSEDWTFAVVYDPDPERRRRIFAEPLDDERGLGFPVEPVVTLTMPGSGGAVRYQTFLRRARGYDLLVVEDAFHNLTYPLLRLQGAVRRRIAYWGHGRDRTATAPGPWKRALENVKLDWARRAAGFFAYTQGVRDFLVEHGVDGERIFVLNNTIDIESHRRQFVELSGAREELRRQRGWENRRVLLYVGRINRAKGLDYLAHAVALLRQRDPSYLLAVVGAGDAQILSEIDNILGRDGFQHLGVRTRPVDLAPVFAQSDAYVLPGLVGLGPLMALCHDLTPIIVESPVHSPEVEYLTPANAVILPAGSPAESYARGIAALLEDPDRRARLARAAWPSVRHLTIDAMATSFIGGVDKILVSAAAPASRR